MHQFFYEVTYSSGMSTFAGQPFPWGEIVVRTEGTRLAGGGVVLPAS